MIIKCTYQRKYLLPDGQYEYLSAESTTSELDPLSGDELMEEARRCVVEHSREYLMWLEKQKKVGNSSNS